MSKLLKVAHLGVACVALGVGCDDVPSSNSSSIPQGPTADEPKEEPAGTQVQFSVQLTRYDGNKAFIDGEAEDCAMAVNTFHVPGPLWIDEEQGTVMLEGICAFEAEFSENLVTASEEACHVISGSSRDASGVDDIVISEFLWDRVSGESWLVLRERSPSDEGDHIDCVTMAGAQEGSPASMYPRKIYTHQLITAHQSLPVDEGEECGGAVFIAGADESSYARQLSLRPEKDDDGRESVVLETYGCRLEMTDVDGPRECVPLHDSRDLPRLWVEEFEHDERHVTLSGRFKTDKLEYCIHIEGDAVAK